MENKNKKIENWLSVDESKSLDDNDENNGLVEFYSLLLSKTFQHQYIDDIPIAQNLLTPTYIKEMIYDIDNNTTLKKHIFFINFLIQENYLGVIPRLTIIKNKICSYLFPF